MNDVFKQYKELFSDYYKNIGKEEAIKLFNEWNNSSTQIYPFFNENNEFLGAIAKNKLETKNLSRLGFFIGDKTKIKEYYINSQTPVKSVGAEILSKVDLREDLITFPNINSVKRFIETGWFYKQVIVCSIQVIPSLSKYNIQEFHFENKWIEDRYKNHHLNKLYKIFNYKDFPLVLKKYDNSCQILEYCLSDIEEIIPIVNYIAYNWGCSEINFWDTQYVPANIKRNPTQTTVGFSNYNIYSKLNNNLYMGLSDVF